MSNYPTSIDELAEWAKQHGVTKTEARRRFAQFVVLEAVASHTIRSSLAFKGGNALRFIYNNRRSTIDLDFTARDDFPDQTDAIRKALDAALKAVEQRLLIKARCQALDRNPPGDDKTMPTYDVTVCYQIPGDRYYKNFDEPRNYSEVVRLEISLNEVVCESQERPLVSSSHSIITCTLEDIIAEKLRALLQQVIRNRSRPQDVYDIAAMTRAHGASLDPSKVASFLVKKANARQIEPRKSLFNENVYDKASKDYDVQIGAQTTDLIPFDEAWQDVLTLVHHLDIPD